LTRDPSESDRDD